MNDSLPADTRLRWEVGFVTNPGKLRDHNEDEAGWRRRLSSGDVAIALADGMGRHAGGEVASKIAVTSILDQMIRECPQLSADERLDAIVAALAVAHSEIVAQADANPKLTGMGTTAIAGWLSRDSVAFQYVGDSRLYWLRKGQVLRVTRDQTAAQVLVDLGRIAQSDAVEHPMSSTLTSWLGCGTAWGTIEVAPASLEEATFVPVPGDVVLLCSDGVYSEVSDAILTSIACAPGRARIRAERIVSAVLEQRARDNATALVAIARRCPLRVR